jgi:hypothetical protein
MSSPWLTWPNKMAAISLLTLTLEPLVDEPVEEGAAMVAEGGAGVRVHAEPVLRAVVLQIRART